MRPKSSAAELSGTRAEQCATCNDCKCHTQNEAGGWALQIHRQQDLHDVKQDDCFRDPAGKVCRQRNRAGEVRQHDRYEMTMTSRVVSSKRLAGDNQNRMSAAAPVMPMNVHESVVNKGGLCGMVWSR